MKAQKSSKTKKKWLLTGGLGACFFGFGICGIVECGFLKHTGSSTYLWVGLGTLSIVITVLGVVLLIKAGFLEQELKN